jgi:transposase-like protein
MSQRQHRSSRRPGGFQPPHCPNPACPFHIPRPDWQFVRRGSHIRKGDRRRIQDYLCRHCNRSFSAPTFSTTYWLKRPDLLIPIAQLLTEGAALRQAARVLGTSHSTVARHLSRLARHCMLFHHNLLRDLPLSEPLVVDGFETFAYSQYFPFHVNLAVGAKSWMIYHFTDAPLRRSGRMRAEQKRIRAELEARYGRPDPKAVEKSMAGLLKPLLPMVPEGEPLLLHSDDLTAYRLAWRRLRREVPACPVLDHRITLSTVRRTQRNPLFPVNLADLLLRHGSANHRRETIAFSKRRLAAIERVAIFTVWRNLIKKRREKASWPTPTAAMSAGVIDRPLRWKQVLRRRLFPHRSEPPREWQGYYWGRIESEVCGLRPKARVCTYAV